MKIKIIHLKDRGYEMPDMDILFVDDVEVLCIGGYMEPEDAILGRDLIPAIKIASLMKLAFETGKSGETFELEEITMTPKEYGY